MYIPVNLIRCAVVLLAANYRATRRAKSKADFINKFKIVEEELDETLFFLELIVAFNNDKRETSSNLI